MSNKVNVEVLFGDVSININSIISVSFGALTRGSTTDLIEFGIYANRGDLSFIDYDGRFKELYNQYNENTTAIATLKLGDNLVATLNVGNADFDEETKRVDITLISSLWTWQNIKVSKIDLFDAKLLFHKKSLQDIIKGVASKYDVNIRVADKLSDIFIECPDFEDGITLWNLYTQVCQVGLCIITEDRYGNAVCYDETPNKTNYVINPSNIISVGKPTFASVPNLSFSVLDIEKHENELTETKSVYLYNQDGSAVDFEQAGIRITGLGSGSETASYPSIEYDLTSFNNPIFDAKSLYGSAEWYNQETNETYSKKITFANSNIDALLPFFRISISAQFLGKILTNIADTSSPYKVVTRANISVKGDYYTRNAPKTKSYTTMASKEQKTLSTNDLFQEQNIFRIWTDPSIPLHEEILNTIKSKYSKPIRCVEIECLLDNYLSIDNPELDLFKDEVFNTYDTVVPYVVRNGKRQPFSVDEYGNASQYVIVGAQYLYEGIFKQKLYLQEIRP